MDGTGANGADGDTMKQKQSPFLLLLVFFTYVCSLFDLWYTMYALDFVEGARELNPVFALLMRRPLAAVVYKYAVLPLALYLLYRNRDKRIAVWGIYLCALCFGITVLRQLLTPLL